MYAAGRNDDEGKTFLQKYWPLMSFISFCIRWLVLIVFYAMKHKTEYEKENREAPVLSVEYCMQKCDPLPVSYYVPGYVIMNAGTRYEYICLAGSDESKCTSHFDFACYCGVGARNK